ncbi:hypothetical protein GCM10011391_27940 [Pullulanibacillus camelliae]|uniref:Uncharacterized protein n=1 Tax=Pullulanibacillus camelliae TaxID=1707096 RepID=A0A8J2YJU6_9BACL|nr:hypothetical protein [Pullulanibacillus camelliae]GGE47541.1 hypothetical protein GCM10011391_27940 [Pullulanibacillus camelliae]
MEFQLTTIGFNYSDRSKGDYDSVRLNFRSTGGTFAVSGYIDITKDQYKDAAGDVDKFADLIKQGIVTAINGDETTKAE